MELYQTEARPCGRPLHKRGSVLPDTESTGIWRDATRNVGCATPERWDGRLCGQPSDKTDEQDSTGGTIDNLYGNAGNDTIYCYSDTNYAFGGEDDDTYYAFLNQYTEIYDESGNNDNLNIKDTKVNTNIFVNFKWLLIPEQTITDDYIHGRIEDCNLYIKHDTASEDGITIKDFFKEGDANKIENIYSSDSSANKMNAIDLYALGVNIQTWLNDYHGEATSVQDVLTGSDAQSVKDSLIAAFNASITWS